MAVHGTVVLGKKHEGTWRVKGSFAAAGTF